MSTLTQLNTFSELDIEFTADTVVIERATDGSFEHVPVTWNVVRTLGPLTGTGVQITYTITSGGTSITFPDAAYATHTLSINTVGSATTVGNILNVLDYNAATATLSKTGTANVTYTVSHINTNDLAGNIIVDYVGEVV